jgi:hypothetical protein
MFAALRVVIMSATIAAQRFADYFGALVCLSLFFLCPSLSLSASVSLPHTSPLLSSSLTLAGPD